MREDPKVIRSKIVTSFITEFNDHGVNLNLDNVAKRIHISKKTIYRYFDSKSDIYIYVLKTTREYILQKQKEILEADNISLLEKLTRILTIKTPFEDYIDFSHIHELRTAEPEVYEEIRVGYSDQWEYFICLIEEGKAKGIIRPSVNARLAAEGLSAAMTSFYKKDVLEQAHVTY